MASVSIEIVRVTPTDLTPDLLAQTEAIFFEASGRTFEPGGERDAFRERWFGRYLSGGSDALFLALAPGGRVAGYLVGAVEEPGPQPRFADISYFRTDFAELCRRFPAHLHINLAPEFRSRGIGPRLIDAFGAHAAKSWRSGHARGHRQGAAQCRLLCAMRPHRARRRVVEWAGDRVSGARVDGRRLTPRVTGWPSRRSQSNHARSAPATAAACARRTA